MVQLSPSKGPPQMRCSADPSRLYLPKPNGHLDLLSISALYQKIHVSHACQLLTSQDPITQHIAKLRIQKEENQASCLVAKSTCIVGSSVLCRGQPGSGEDCIMLQSGLTRSLVAKYPQRSVHLCYVNIVLQGRNAAN